MAKKLNKLVARIVALESALAKLLTGNNPLKTKKKAKRAAKKTAKKPVAKARRAGAKRKANVKPKAKSIASRKTARPAAPVRKAKKKIARKRKIPLPMPEQIVVSGMPEFATPLERM